MKVKGRRSFLAGVALAAASAAPGLRTAEAASPKKAPCRQSQRPLKELADRIAFVTGGSSGIGFGIVQAFVEAGVKVAFSYRTKAHLDQVMQQLWGQRERVHAIQLDVTDRRAMEEAAAETARHFGKIHMLVNNAGVISPSTTSQTSYEDWDWLMGINVTGVFNGIKSFLPHIRAHGEPGHIVTVSSVLGLAVLGPELGAYCASKFAVTGLMEALRAELAQTPVGVSVCCPGVIRSNLTDSRRQQPSAPSIQTELATDPLDLGRRVVDGIRKNELYILSHAEFGSLIQLRSDALAKAAPREPSIPEARRNMVESSLDTSIYLYACA